MPCAWSQTWSVVEMRLERRTVTPQTVIFFFNVSLGFILNNRRCEVKKTVGNGDLIQ